MLDAYGGLYGDRQEVKAACESLFALKQQIAELTQQEKDRAGRLDLLRYQINEIESSNLTPGEEEALSDEIKFLNSAGRLAELANDAYDSLYSSDSACITKFSHILNAMREIANIDARANEALKSLENAGPLLEDASYFLRDYKDRLEFDPERLEQLQERLELIKG